MLKNGKFYYDGKYIPEFQDDFQVGNTWRGYEIKKIDLAAVVAADQYPRAILDLTLMDEEGETVTERVAAEYLEETAQEAFKALYIEAYDEAITALVPDFDAAADKESGSPWCLCELQYVDAKNVADIIEQAKAHAEKHALEIAQLLADDFENADGMPRIILFDGDKYSIYDINNCLDVFGRCENGIDFEAIKTAFDRTETATSFEAFKKLAQGFEPIKDLDDLYQKMLKDHPSVMDKYGNAWSSDLPNFGGEEPGDTDGVWSWDEKRLIIGEFSGDLAIITREEFAERQQ